jgi:peptidoglycan/LPS O-acetylase OafA/YrhL
MAMIFLYHTNRFFNTEDWHVKNGSPNDLSDWINEFMVVFIMPLFFVLSGISTQYSLRFRDGRTFISARMKRLVVPLVFGIFLLGPPQVYLERLSHGDTSLAFIPWFPQYFDGMYMPGEMGNFAWHGMHLWYLFFLFLFSLITLPVFLRWRGDDGRIRAALVYLVTWPSVIIVLPVAILYLAVTPWWSDVVLVDVAGWSMLTYLAFFTWGFLLASDERYQDAISRHAWVALVAAVATSPAWVEDMWVLKPLSSWCFMVAFLGLGQRYLRDVDNRYLKYGNEAVLPFYILHQPALLIVGYQVVQLDLPWPAKYVLIAIIAFGLIMGIYEMLVRRWNPTRFLFGLKVRPRG